MKQKQNGFGLIGILIIIGTLILTAGGVVVWRGKTDSIPSSTPTPTPATQTQPTASPAEPIDQCSGLNEKECLANSDCIPVYGPSCQACMDIRFERCRDRLSCQTGGDCPPVLGVCMPWKCPTYRCFNGRCVFFEDAMVLESCLKETTLEKCYEKYGQ